MSKRLYAVVAYKLSYIQFCDKEPTSLSAREEKR